MLKITVPHSSMNCWCLRLLLLFTVALSVSVNSSSSQCSIKVLLSHLVPVFLVQIFLFFFFFLSCRTKHWLKKPHGARHLQGPRGETRCLVVLPYRHSLGFNFKIRKILDVKKINKKETSLGNSCLLYPQSTDETVVKAMIFQHSPLGGGESKIILKNQSVFPSSYKDRK